MPCSVAMAFNMAPFVIAFAPAFIDFIGGNMMWASEGTSSTRTSKVLVEPL